MRARHGELDSEKNAFLRALGMEFVDWINEGQVEGGVISAGECSDGSCLRTAFSSAGVRNASKKACIDMGECASM